MTVAFLLIASDLHTVSMLGILPIFSLYPVCGWRSKGWVAGWVILYQLMSATELANPDGQVQMRKLRWLSLSW